MTPTSGLVLRVKGPRRPEVAGLAGAHAVHIAFITTATIACSAGPRASRKDGKCARRPARAGPTNSTSPTLVVYSHSGGRDPSRWSTGLGRELAEFRRTPRCIKLARGQHDCLAHEVLKPTVAHLRDDIGNRCHTDRRPSRCLLLRLTLGGADEHERHGGRNHLSFSLHHVYRRDPLPRRRQLGSPWSGTALGKRGNETEAASHKGSPPARPRTCPPTESVFCEVSAASLCYGGGWRLLDHAPARVGCTD
jgi:hypothetical protein